MRDINIFTNKLDIENSQFSYFLCLSKKFLENKEKAEVALSISNNIYPNFKLSP